MPLNIQLTKKTCLSQIFIASVYLQFFSLQQEDVQLLSSWNLSLQPLSCLQHSQIVQSFPALHFQLEGIHPQISKIMSQYYYSKRHT